MVRQIHFDRFSISNRGRLSSSLEEYLDHIHYMQDIFLLNVDSLCNVLKEQLMNRLLIPVYVFSLIKREKFSRVKVSVEMRVRGDLELTFSSKDPRTMIDQSSALFLLAEVSHGLIDKLELTLIFVLDLSCPSASTDY